MVARRVARTGLLGVAGIALLTSVSCSSTGGESASSTSSPSTTSGGGAGSTTSTAAPTTTGKAAANETTTTAGAATDEFKTSALRAYLAQNDPAAAEAISPSGGITISDSQSEPRRGSVTIAMVDGSAQDAALAMCETVSAWAYPLKSEATVQIKVGDAIVVKRVSEAGSCAPSSGG